MSAGARTLRIWRRRGVIAAAIPGTPDGVLHDTVWELEGAGTVGTGVLPKGHPYGGPHGKRIIWGEGIWPAEISPSFGDLSLASSQISPRAYIEPVSLVVYSPAGAITGYISQPGRRGSLFKDLTSGLRREASKVLIEAGDRAWWLRAVKIFGVRVTRASGEPVLVSKRLHLVFMANADELDISITLLTFTAIGSSFYAPILGQ
ncbi:hypothetical protein [Frankia sp. Cr1]|uniref:hypothetical protein n=1 Tax=Frankia sp. Cr1 TaxID=3073931 RepID=UPI002AD2DFA9|nr:hypothetical protein [Frankia sp. Cr1]